VAVQVKGLQDLKRVEIRAKDLPLLENVEDLQEPVQRIFLLFGDQQRVCLPINVKVFFQKAASVPQVFQGFLPPVTHFSLQALDTAAAQDRLHQDLPSKARAREDMLQNTQKKTNSRI